MLFSIVMPVYKTEKYIRRAIDSVLQQEFVDYEIILIDDGSPDSCGEICDEYAKNNSKIKVIHKQNEGVSVARNTGVEHAIGDYVCFVDSDDEMAENCLLIANDLIEKNKDIDLLQMGWCCLKEGDTKPKRMLDSYNVETHTKRDALKMFLCFKTFQHAPWSKFIKRTLLAGLNFPVGVKIGEDLEHSYKILDKAENILVTDAVAYYQWERQGSAMMSRDVFGIADAYGVYKRMYEYFSKYPELRFLVTKRYVNDIIQLLRDLNNMENNNIKKDIEMLIFNTLTSISDENLDDKKTIISKNLVTKMPCLYFCLHRIYQMVKKKNIK